MSLFQKNLQPVPCTLYPNQKGLSSLVLLFAIVLGVFLIWEFNEYIRLFTNPPTPPGDQNLNPGGGTNTFCQSGEQGNCNDSNDNFIFTN